MTRLSDGRRIVYQGGSDGTGDTPADLSRHSPCGSRTQLAALEYSAGDSSDCGSLPCCAAIPSHAEQEHHPSTARSLALRAASTPPHPLTPALLAATAAWTPQPHNEASRRTPDGPASRTAILNRTRQSDKESLHSHSQTLVCQQLHRLPSGPVWTLGRCDTRTDRGSDPIVRRTDGMDATASRSGWPRLEASITD